MPPAEGRLARPQARATRPSDLYCGLPGTSVTGRPQLASDNNEPRPGIARSRPASLGRGPLRARQVLWEWGLTAFSESTELLISELVTNAMRASRATTQYLPVRLWVVSDSAQLVIFVWDASPLPPAANDAADDAENGRGLMIVQAISAR